MSLSHHSVAQLEGAVQLLKEREVIQSRLAEIDKQLRRLENNITPVPAVGKNQPLGEHRDAKGRPYRISVQRAVVKVLIKAGADGLSVKELAFRAKIKTASLRTWLYTKGKTVEGIVQKGRGVFAYRTN